VFALSDKELPHMCEKSTILLVMERIVLEWLLVPYKNYENLTDSKLSYNKTFCATRVLIENSFGLLKSRFRQSIQVDIHSVNKITKFIISCCV